MRSILRLVVFLYAFFIVTAQDAQNDTRSSIRETFTDAQRKEINANSESFSFQAEVSRLMDIIINSLYTQKEVFLRELISNAADALEKARFMAVSESGYLGDQTELDIRIEIDPEEKTLTIQDSGIGMTRDDLINNLGTVARSGTTNFLEAIAETIMRKLCGPILVVSGGDLNLIGQFGVGFYSAFLVADRVTVTSKNNNDPDQHIWESMIGGSFTIAKDPRGNTLGRGTRITLHLKDDSTEFLDQDMVKQTVLRFNQFVNFPIKLRMRKEVTPESKTDDADKKEEEIDLDDKKEETETDQKKTEEPRVEYHWELINSQKPIWMRPKENVTEAEYIEFYKAIARDTDPAAYTHFTAEGEVEFRAILYIPGHAPYDSWMSYFAAKQESIKLYARRVLVADSVYELLPKWLNFIKGVVDSDDLPLKVDRESFSQSRVIKIISKKIVGKFLELLKKLSKEDVEAWEEYRKKANETTDQVQPPKTTFGKVWAGFERNLKVGCVEDDANREKIARVLRFISTRYGKNETITLDDYVSRMPESQKSIYYISNENFDAAMNSPYMQVYKNKGIEVLVLTSPVDESCLSRLRVYNDKKLVSIEKSSSVPDETEEQKEYQKRVKKAFEPLTTAWTKHLKNIVSGVRVTHTLVDDPAVVTTASYTNSAYADRIARSQTFGNAQSEFQWIYRHLDINPNHPLIKRMLQLAKADPNDPKLEEAAKTIHDAALFSSGFVVDDPAPLARKLFKLLQTDAGVPQDEPVEEYKLTPEEQNAPIDEAKNNNDDGPAFPSMDDFDDIVEDNDPSEAQDTVIEKANDLSEAQDTDASSAMKDEL